MGFSIGRCGARNFACATRNPCAPTICDPEQVRK